MRERWRRCRGYPGYKVSSLGRVRSCPRVLADGRAHGGQMLTPYADKDGYLCVWLRRRHVRVHHLVLEAFDSLRPEGLEGCHGPGGNQDNRADVLRWDTHQENIRDRDRNKPIQPERLDWLGTDHPRVVGTSVLAGAARA